MKAFLSIATSLRLFVCSVANSKGSTDKLWMITPPEKKHLLYMPRTAHIPEVHGRKIRQDFLC